MAERVGIGRNIIEAYRAKPNELWVTIRACLLIATVFIALDNPGINTSSSNKTTQIVIEPISQERIDNNTSFCPSIASSKKADSPFSITTQTTACDSSSTTFQAR